MFIILSSRSSGRCLDIARYLLRSEEEEENNGAARRRQTHSSGTFLRRTAAESFKSVWLVGFSLFFLIFLDFLFFLNFQYLNAFDRK